MVRLLILRHAKALSPSGILDIDRPLAPVGVEAAASVGKFLLERELIPDLVLVSPAVRTMETWDLVRRETGQVRTREEDQIYAAPAPRLLDMVQQVGGTTGSIMLVGHNPGCEDLAQLLIGSGDAHALMNIRRKFPPAALAVIEFKGESWAEIEPGSGHLNLFVTPDDLGVGASD